MILYNLLFRIALIGFLSISIFADEDKKKEDKDDQPPNQIGDVVIRDPEPPKPTVVKSTAPASTASFTPVGFNVGNLNDLIARITGVPTPRRMQEGGTVAAVDRISAPTKICFAWRGVNAEPHALVRIIRAPK